MKISDELIRKYNIQVPRYTSYPPANHFTEDFTGNDYLHLLERSNSDSPENIAFYIHIPFCRKICFYCGCNACSIGSGSQVKPYMNALKKEIEIITGKIDRSRPVSQIHYGGGTPNSIDASLLAGLNGFFFSEFKFIEDPEIAIECNPAYLDQKYIDMLVDAGFNRFSLGIQDFDRQVLDGVNRLPSAIPPAELFGYLKEKDTRFSVNFDFIYGLPGQTEKSFSQTIEQAIQIRPDRIVTFSYAHVPWLKKHQLILEKKGLPSPEDKLGMFMSSYELLKSSGYQPIGLDHFVLPSDDLFRALSENKLHRNFQGYCTRRTTGQVYAFGVTAISQLQRGYSQNAKDTEQYVESLERGELPVERGYILSEEQICIRETITQIMCNKKVNFNELARSFRIDPDHFMKIISFDTDKLKEFENDGLIRLEGNEMEVTETGTIFIRNIASSFDREYKENKRTYSKPV